MTGFKTAHPGNTVPSNVIRRDEPGSKKKKRTNFRLDIVSEMYNILDCLTVFRLTNTT